jgi:hypothetical protein
MGKRKPGSRSVFDDADSTPMVHPGQSPEIPEGGQYAASIPTAQKKRRKRPWDKRHSHLIRTYRGIPQELHDWFVQLAKENSIPVGDVVRFALERFKKAYQADEISLNPTPKTGRMTLYPWEENEE